MGSRRTTSRSILAKRLGLLAITPCTCSNPIADFLVLVVVQPGHSKSLVARFSQIEG